MQTAWTPLVLSLFPGIDLLGRGFEAEGAVIVRGPDPLFGGDIASFIPPPEVFQGIIGGPPCQNFSIANPNRRPELGMMLVYEFLRCVTAAAPDWFVMENVVGVPDVVVDGYRVQRLNLNARECGLAQNRLRTIQFGSRDGVGLVIDRGQPIEGPSQPCALASEGARAGRRTWGEFCQLQGLPADFDLPGFKKGEKYRAVGNGVPVPMARVVARAVRDRHVTANARVCVCDCGRRVTGRQLSATPGCRKRMERRRRDSVGVIAPGPLTGAASLFYDVGSLCDAPEGHRQ